MFHKSVGVVLAFVLFAAPLHAQPREPLVEQVRKAIERGVQFLRDQEEGQGNWEHVDPASGSRRGVAVSDPGRPAGCHQRRDLSAAAD